MSNDYKSPPEFSSDKLQTCLCHVDELTCKFVPDLLKEKQLLVITSLPENNSTKIRDKGFSELNISNLKVKDSVDTLVCFLDKIFKKDVDCHKHSNSDIINNYITETEKLYCKTKKNGMELPQTLLVFKLLDYAGPSHKNQQLSGVNYSEPYNVYTNEKCTEKVL